MENDKAIKVIKEIRQIQDEMYNKSQFCRSHNFDLEAEKFRFAEDKIRRICSLLEDEFDTGYVSLPK